MDEVSTVSDLLFFTDTETTGIPDFNKPAEAEGQPRVASMAGVLVRRSDREIISFYNLPIKPDGWVMSAELEKIHGLSHEFLCQHGVKMACVLDLYEHMLEQGAVIVAHNAQFDLKMMRGELRRAGRPDLFENTWRICTYRQSPDDCKHARGNKRLGTMYEYYTGQKPKNAHRAIGDVQMLRQMFFAMEDKGINLQAQLVAQK